MIIAVPKEASGERRVALTPDVIAKLTKVGHIVHIAMSAGSEAGFSDSEYQKSGAVVVTDMSALLEKAEIIVKVGAPTSAEMTVLRPGTIIIGLLNPLGNPTLIRELATRNVTTLSLELIPRISRAQAMDVLSSQASLAGYKAVLLAAARLGRFFPMLTTAAGTMLPAKVLIIGVGVAGLQAIATARRLGAVVEAFDIRPAAKQEVESLGAKFIEVKLEEKTEAHGGYAREVSEDTKRREREVLAQHVRQSDVVITAALVPGKKAPLLITADMITGMKRGSIILDMAAEQGGNVAGTKPGEDVLHEGITIMGPTNLPSTVPTHASHMFARNVTALILHLTKEGKLSLDRTDEITRAIVGTQSGEVT